MPPQVNAHLLTVGAQGSTDDFNAPAGADTPLFDGSLPVYYEERRDRRLQVGGADVVVWRSIIVDDTHPLDFDVGQRLTWRYRAQDLTGIVQAVERSDDPEMPADLRTTRLTMELA